MTKEDKNPLLPPFYLAGHELDWPLTNAAGSINGTNEEQITREVKDLSETAIGAIKYGTITIPAQASYGIYEYDEGTGESDNHMGLPNPGRAGVRRLLPKLVAIAHERGKPFILGIGATANDKERSFIKQIEELTVEFLDSDVDLIEINPNSPHTIDERGEYVPNMAYDLEGMEELTEVLWQSVGATDRLSVKVPPVLKAYHEKPPFNFRLPDYLRGLDDEWVHKLAKIVKARNIFRVLVASNSIPNQKNINGYQASKSGASFRVRVVGREQLNHWSCELENSGIDIGSELGVTSGRELAYRVRIGASAGGGVTFLWRSGSWKEAVKQVLDEYQAEALAID